MPRHGETVFDAEWKRRSCVRVGTLTEADRFIRAHYLRKRPAVVVLTLIVCVDGQSSGAIIFAMPPKETATRYQTIVWELARLYLVDEMPKNSETFVISQAVKIVKRIRPEVGCLVSYADPSAGHHGVIYKAANWHSDGHTDEGRVSPRFDMVTTEMDLLGERVKKFGRAGHVPIGADVQRLPRNSKPRFVYWLRKRHVPSPPVAKHEVE